MKHTKRILIMALVTLLMIPFASLHAMALDIDPSLPAYVEGALLVQFERDLPEPAKEAILEHANAKAIEQLNDKGLILVEFNSARPIHSVINQFKNRKGVVFAEPDYMLYAIEPTQSTYVNPDDETYYDLLWGLNNVGQDILGINGLVDLDIDAPEAWNVTAGSSDVIVAVIDTAVDLNHPDLQDKIVEYVKYHRGREDKTHGTHVAGTIAANDNTIGVVGVAPSVKIKALAFLGNNGGSTSDAIKAINYASQEPYPADIINASWGGGGYSQALYDAIENFGKPFVAAAGNDGVNTDVSKHYPSSYGNSNIVSVAAVDNLGQLASFSNYGASDVDVGAPGVDIASTYPGGYAWMGGTSMAAPHVAGVLALMTSHSPSSSTSELIDALYTSGVDLNALDGITVTGKMVNAFGALNALNVTPPSNVAPTVTITSPADNSTIPEGTVISFTATATDPEDGDLSGSITWSSDLDGPINASGSALSVGTHLVTASVTDLDGAPGEDSITVTVEVAPVEGETSVALSYSTEGGRNSDAHLVLTFSLSDGTNPVDGASVSVDVLLDGSIIKSFDGVTSGGVVAVKIKKASSGMYSIDNLVIVSTPEWDGVTPTDTFVK